MARNKRKAKADDPQHNVIKISNPHVESVQKSPAKPLSRKKVKKSIPVRRSGRVVNLQPRAANKEMPMEEIQLDDSEEGEEEPLVEEINSEPAPEDFGRSESKINANEKEEVPVDEQFNLVPTPTDLRRMERKIDFLVQSVKEFKSQIFQVNSNAEVKYRSLYIKSQKKIEELTRENRELANSLELAKQKNETINVTMALLKANETITILASHMAASQPIFVEGTTTCDAPGSVGANENNNEVPSSKKKPRRKK